MPKNENNEETCVETVEGGICGKTAANHTDEDTHAFIDEDTMAEGLRLLLNKKVKVDDPCIVEVPGYGKCGRPATHIVHQMMRISPVEHLYKRELKGQIEEMRLSKRNIKKIARRSNKSVEELETMRQVALKKGKVITVRYEVVDNFGPMKGFKADKILLDEINGE